jgi:hypothetical protein
MASTRIVVLLYYKRGSKNYRTKHTKKRRVKCNWRMEGKKEGM